MYGTPQDSDYPNTRLYIKLLVPRARDDLIRRPRLEDLLEKGLRRKLVLLSAPVGFGKTSILSQYVPICGMPVGWLTLDGGDNDQTLFLQYLVAAMQTVGSGVGQCVLDILHSHQPGAMEIVMAALANEVLAIPDDFLLVLDNYSSINAPQVHDSVSFLLDNMPASMHMIIAGRSDPPFPLASMRSRGELVEIRADDLRLTSSEAMAFLERNLGFRPSQDDLDLLQSRTEGWIAGLQLAVLAASRKEDISHSLREFKGSHRHLADLLLAEIFMCQPPDTQAFLLETSILDHMTGPMCDEVLGRTQSQRLLEHLEHENLFVVPLDDRRTWYRYHQLFSEFLLHRLSRDHPDRVVELHRQAAAWFERNSLTAEAIEHALAANEFDQVIQLVRPVAVSMLTHGQHLTLARWLGAIPEEILFEDPQLCLWYASAFLVTGIIRERPLQRAESAVVDKANLGYVLSMRAHAACLNRDLDGAVALSRRALAVLSPDDLFLRSVVNLFLGEAFYLKGEVERALEALSEARSLAHASDNLLVSLMASEILGLTYVLAGRLHQAAGFFNQVIDNAIEKQCYPPSVLGHLGKALVLWEWNDLEAAMDHLEWCDRRERFGFLLAQVHAAMSHVFESRGDYEKALAELDKATEVLHPVKEADLIATMRAYQARIWLLQGDLTAAVKWSQYCGLTCSDPPLYEHETAHLTLVRVLISMGRPGEALQLLEQLMTAAESAGRGGVVIEILVLQAIAFAMQKRHENAMIVFERALAMGASGGYLRTFLDEGMPVAELLFRSDSTEIDAAYTERLRAAFEEEAGILPLTGKELVEPLTGREVEVLRLVVAGASNNEIATQMYISENTVKKHVSNIFQKLNVTNRLQAANRVRELRLV